MWRGQERPFSLPRFGHQVDWVRQDGDAGGPGECLPEKLKPLGREVAADVGQPSEVPARPREARNEPGRDGVTDQREVTQSRRMDKGSSRELAGALR